MDVLKIIPQSFFDLIARVVPGAVGLIAYLLLYSTSWDSIVTTLFGQVTGEAGASTMIFIFLGCSFVIGQLISPAAKLLQRFGEKFYPKKEKNNYYDRLRLEKPYVGALCAKIRAEFTMHFGLAAVFVISSILYPFSLIKGNLWVYVILITVSITEFIRGYLTNETFNQTVVKFGQEAFKDDKKETT